MNALHPDLVVFTGDALDEDDGRPLFQGLMSQLRPAECLFAVRGNHDVDRREPTDLFTASGARELTGEPVRAAGITLCGAPYGQPEAIGECLGKSRGFRLVLYHTPDFVEALQPWAPDVYLAGHTHGGQIRLPLYGAVLTNSAFDKRYEMGLYQVGRTALYVNRGIGSDAGPLRMRFLCRPEIAVIDLVGNGSGARCFDDPRSGRRADVFIGARPLTSCSPPCRCRPKRLRLQPIRLADASACSPR